jgi:transposase InsO family protein
MEVARSGYYHYLQKKKNLTIEPDIKLIIELKALHTRCKESYGTRRMVKALLAQGYKIGRYKTRRLMRQNRISCKQRRRYTVTTKSDHSLTIADNILNRNFCVEKPNRAWVSDITYLWTTEGWLYIAAVLDLFSRRVVGWSMADHMRADLVENAFMMAKIRRIPHVGFLHHSDRGVQYASEQYQRVLQASGAIVSMSRKGNCWDNAVMERFFGTLKSERTDGKHYVTRNEAKADVIDFIEMFYNNQRLHSTLNYMSPVAYEMNYEKNIYSIMESRMKSPYRRQR